MKCTISCAAAPEMLALLGLAIAFGIIAVYLFRTSAVWNWPFQRVQCSTLMRILETQTWPTLLAACLKWSLNWLIYDFIYFTYLLCHNFVVFVKDGAFQVWVLEHSHRLIPWYFHNRFAIRHWYPPSLSNTVSDYTIAHDGGMLNPIYANR